MSHPDVLARIVLRGRGLDEGFVAFVVERARLFSLCGRVVREADGRLVVSVGGPAGLIDMLEVACMLGPVHSFVDDIERQVLEAGVPAGRFERD